MHILLLFVALPLVVGVLILAFTRKAPRVGDILANLTGIVLLLMALALVRKTGVYWIGGHTPDLGIPVGIALVLDKASLLVLLAINFIGFMAMLYSVRFFGASATKARFYGLFLLVVAGLNGIALAGDLLSLYVCLELASVASYSLVALGRREGGLEAGFRYLLASAVGSILVLIGMAITYGTTGNLNIAQIAKVVSANAGSASLLAVGFFIAGFGVKAAIIPFHAWLDEASTAAPAPVSAMLSGVMLATSGIYALARVLYNALGMPGPASAILLVLGALSIVIGALVALRHDDFKRVLAYHTVSDMGYVLLGFGLGTRLGIAVALFHLVNQAVYKTLLFFNAGSIEYATGTIDMNRLAGLRGKMPVTGATAAIGSFAIAGVPPFSGFWSKLFVIVAAVQAEHYGYAAWAVLGSILTVASFARLRKRMLAGEAEGSGPAPKEVPGLMQASMIILAALCVLMGLLWLPKIQDGFFMQAGKVIQEGVTYGTNILGR